MENASAIWPFRGLMTLVILLLGPKRSPSHCFASINFAFDATRSTVDSPGIFQNGSFIIGGLFAIHFASKNISTSLRCLGRFNLRGYEEAKAMIYAIDKINNDDSILPGIKLGFDIKDTCNSVDFAIRKSLNFSFIEKNIEASVCPSLKLSGTPQVSQTIAIIGPGTSDVAMAVTNLAGLFYVPVVDYSSSSRLLSNRIRFKYFLRTISSDILLSRAIVDILRKFGWNFINVLYSDTDYGRSAIETFEYVLKASSSGVKMCIATKVSFTMHSSDGYLRSIIDQIKSAPRARGVILLTTVQDTELILNRFQAEGMTEYVFIATDYFSGSIEQFSSPPEMLRRVIGVIPHVEKDSLLNFTKIFDTPYLGKEIGEVSWQKEYTKYRKQHNNSRKKYQPSLYVPYAIDAVYAVAYGLHDMLNCSPTIGCSVSPEQFTDLNWKGDRLLKSIEAVQFKGLTRDPVKFDKYGNSIGVYDITIVNPLTAEWEPFGSWASNTSHILEISSNTSLLLMNETRLQEIWNMVYKESGIPNSVCGRKCYPGHWIKPEDEHQACCWKCLPCSGNEISHSPVKSSCLKCPAHYWPNDNHTICDNIIPTSVTLSDPPGVVVVMVATLGSITVIFVTVVFYRHGNTHLVRSSSKLLSYVMLFGIILGYLTAMLVFVERTEVLCRTVLYLFSISFSIVVGTLLTKTNRIHRIFSKKAMRKGMPPCLSDKWMLSFIAGFVAIEVLICTVIVFTTSDGRLREVIYSTMKNEAFLQCKFYATYADYHMAVWWTYNTGIVLVCTYQAYLTRKVPGNYNEARFIAFTMLTISTDVLVFFLSYYGTRGYYKDVLVSSFLIVADTITLCCVFLPKVYIILLRPEKNVVHGSVKSLGIIDSEETEMRKISHVSQRSYTSYLSNSSGSSNAVVENSRLVGERNPDVENTSKRKRKMSMFVQNGLCLESRDELDGRESGPGSLETVLDSVETPDDIVSAPAKMKVSRMSSDMSARSVHFEDEVPSVIIEEFDPNFFEGFEYRRRESTI